MAKKKNRPNKSKKHIGQVPGALVYTGNKESNSLLIESFDYTPDSYTELELKTVEEAFTYKSTRSKTWINFNGLNKISEIEKVGKYYNLHPLILEDIVNTSQRPKIDEYNEYLFLVLKMMYYDENEEIVSEQVSLVLGHNYVLTFQEAEGDVFDSLRDRIRFGKGRIRNESADYLLYTLIDAIVDNYFLIIETDKLQYQKKLIKN